MIFKDLSIYLQKLENTASRNDMILILAELFEKVTTVDFDKVMYLLQGRVVQLYVNIEFGMAVKMIIKALAVAYEIDEKTVSAEFKRIGDIGELAEKLSLEVSKSKEEVTINRVYSELEGIAKTTGTGSVEKKTDSLSNLLTSTEPLSCRYIARIIVSK